MTEPAAVSKREKRGGLSRTRVVGARVLTVVAIVLALVGMLGYYVAHTALDQDGFKTISENMIQDDAIREQVANTSVDLLFANVDVEAAIADRLPPAQKGLAPVLAGLARSGADQAALTALERPRVQNVWVVTTTATQRQLVRLLDDKTKFETEGGKVVLDLRPIMIGIGDQVAVIGKAAERLPESTGKITIIDKSRLGTAQTLTRILRSVANWMWLLALAVAALAVWLARGRRRIELRALAIGVILVGLLMLAARRTAATTSSTTSPRTTPSSRQFDTRGASCPRRLPTAPGSGSSSVPYCSQESGSSVTPAEQSRPAAPHSPFWRTARRPTASPPSPSSSSRSSLHCSPAAGRRRSSRSPSLLQVSRSSARSCSGRHRDSRGPHEHDPHRVAHRGRARCRGRLGPGQASLPQPRRKGRASKGCRLTRSANQARVTPVPSA